MFIMLESREAIAGAQDVLERTIRRSFKKTDSRTIGFPGGTEPDAQVNTDGTYWFWSEDYRGRDVPNPRRLNWFGAYRESGELYISVEINTSYKGRNDQVAGFFGKDSETGEIYLFHSGRVAGGRKGVGKIAFLAWSDLRLTEVGDASGGIREGVLVMPIRGVAATRSLGRYIDFVSRFKSAVRQGEMETAEFKRKTEEYSAYYSEGRGRRMGTRRKRFEYVSRHGEVVDALYKWRSEKGLPPRARIVKNVHIDLGVEADKQLVEIYEVKTAAGRGEVYTAVGQLMVHAPTEKCRKILVLPRGERLNAGVAKALEKLGIERMAFRLTKRDVEVCE